MELKTQINENIGIISFTCKTLGEPSDTKKFEEYLNHMMSKDIKKIILDLEAVERINSTGLAILITATTLFNDCGGQKVVLSGSNDFINGALAVTKLNQFFECFENVQEAIENMKTITC